MSSKTGRLALQDVIEQGWKQLQGSFLQQSKKTIEGLLAAERDRRVEQCRKDTGGQNLPLGLHGAQMLADGLGSPAAGAGAAAAGPGGDRAAGEIPAARLAGSVVGLDGRGG